MTVVFLSVLFSIFAFSVGADEAGCLCTACWKISDDEGSICGNLGAILINSSVDSCSCEALNTDFGGNSLCSDSFPPDPTIDYVHAFGCNAVDNDTWDGTWELDPCDNGCFLTPGMLGDCLPCCIEDNCDCFHGDVSITENDDGTMTMTIGTSHIESTSYIVPHTGNAGLTATVNVSGAIYDVSKNGDHLTFNERLLGSTGYLCEYSFTRNPSTTNYLKLALLIGGVSLGAGLLLVLFCCNPFKRCRKNKEAKQLEGQINGTPYKPLPSAPSETHAGINYTGGYNDL